MRGAGFKERVDVFVNSLVSALFRLLFLRFLPYFLFFFFFFLVRLTGRLLASFQLALPQEGGWFAAGYRYKNSLQSWIEPLAL